MTQPWSAPARRVPIGRKSRLAAPRVRFWMRLKQIYEKLFNLPLGNLSDEVHIGDLLSDV